MSVITISRDFGSEGDYIATTIAKTLGYHFVDRKFFSTILGQYGLAEFDREYDSLPGFWEKFGAQRYERRDDVVKMLDKVLAAVAQHGNVVILGRSGFEVVRDFADILHVRLQAPFSVRVLRTMDELKITLEQAEQVVNENDKVHMAFVKEYYGIAWDQVHAFDLVINTGKISPQLATVWLLDAVKGLGVNPKSDKPLVGSIGVDEILRNAISDALECEVVH